MFDIVVCTMGNRNLLARLLDILLGDSLVKKMIIVDNNSMDDTVQYVRGLPDKRIELILNKTNKGVIRARNQGLSLATSKYTLVIDDDQIPNRSTLKNYLKALKIYDVVGCEAQIMDFGTGLTKLGKRGNMSYVGAGGMCTKTNIWKAVGLFDEIYQPAYFEDPDFCLKAKKAGYSVGLVENPGILHLAHQTLSRRGLGFDKDRVMIRNRKIFLGRYGVKSAVVPSVEGKIRIMYVLRNLDVGGVQKNTLAVIKNLDHDKYDPVIYVADTHEVGKLGAEAVKYAKVFYNNQVTRKGLSEVKTYKNVGTKPKVLTDKFRNSQVIKPGSDVTDDRFTGLQGNPTFRLVGVRRVQNTEVADAVRKFRPHIVHYQRDLSRISRVLLTLKREMEFKIVRSVHSEALPTNVTGYDKIILLTRSATCKMSKNFKGAPIKLIHNGVDTKVFKPIKVPKEKIILTHTRLAKLIKLVHYKEFYFNVIKAVVQKHPEYKFVAIGGDYNRYKARFDIQMRKAGIRGNLILKDALHGDDLVKAINSCTIWFYPTAQDCFPLSVLEAMACGVPIVASDLTGIKEMLKSNQHGVLCSRKSESEFVDAISMLINNAKLREELGGAATVRANRFFSEENMVNKIKTVYKSLGG